MRTFCTVDEHVPDTDQCAQQRARKQRRSAEVVALQAPAAADPDALLSRHTVSALTGLGATAIYVRVRAKTFPAPRKISRRCSRWKSSEVRAWLREQGAAA
ncbi:helix-turn-helix transcriptional regulator [Rhizobacter fulvus]